jgi:glutamate carboxypeptidase
MNLASKDLHFDTEYILSNILSWASIETPSGHPDAVNQLVNVVETMMLGLGADVERVSGEGRHGDLLKATFKGNGSQPGILILSHLDTVHSVGTLQGPLKIRRDGDRVYGPGVYDMKGGMFLACYAMKRLLEAGIQTHLPVTYLFVPDEEMGSPWTRHLIEAEAKAQKWVLVPEPAHRGQLVSGRYAFLRFRVRVEGKPAHAGMENDLGKSAIAAMAHLINIVEGWSELDRGKSFSVGTVQGGTYVNTVPILCQAEVLAVAPTQEDFEDIVERMRTLTYPDPDIKVVVERGPVRPLFKPTSGTLELVGRAQAIAREYGFSLEHGQFGGGSDGNFTGSLGVPTLDGLGVCGEGAHTHHEHLFFSSLEPRGRLLAGLLETLA